MLDVLALWKFIPLCMCKISDTQLCRYLKELLLLTVWQSWQYDLKSRVMFS